MLARLTATTLRSLRIVQGWPGGHAQLPGTGVGGAVGHDDAFQVDDEGSAARKLPHPFDQPVPPGRPGQFGGQVAPKEGIAGKEEPLDPVHGKAFGAIDLDYVAGGGIKRPGRVLLGVAGRHYRRPALDAHLFLEPELEVLSSHRIQMLGLGLRAGTPEGICEAQDPQGFLRSYHQGLGPGEVVGKVCALDHEGVSSEEGSQGLGQGIPLGGLAVPVQGHGHDPGPGKIMGHKGSSARTPCSWEKRLDADTRGFCRRISTAAASVRPRP